MSVNEQLRRCTKPQLAFLLKLAENRDHVGYTEGGTPGGATTTHLRRKHFIEPFGKVKGRLRWRLAVELTDEDNDLIKEMLSLM